MISVKTEMQKKKLEDRNQIFNRKDTKLALQHALTPKLVTTVDQQTCSSEKVFNNLVKWRARKPPQVWRVSAPRLAAALSP